MTGVAKRAVKFALATMKNFTPDLNSLNSGKNLITASKKT
jgi:hypothetical protein